MERFHLTPYKSITWPSNCRTPACLPSELIVATIVVFLVLSLRNTAGTVIQGASSPINQRLLIDQNAPDQCLIPNSE